MPDKNDGKTLYDFLVYVLDRWGVLILIFLFGFLLGVVLFIHFNAQPGTQVSIFGIFTYIKNQNTDCNEKENCNTISPTFIEPIPKKVESMNVTLRVKVNATPIDHHLWLLVFNENMKIHSDLQQILPNNNMEWIRSVSLKGGTKKDTYNVEIILATNEEHKMFLRCYKEPSKYLCKMPEKYTSCRNIVLSFKN